MRTLGALLFLCLAAAAQEITPDQREFFERKIRPILADSCYACHNAKLKTAFGGLRLDSREGLRKGGDSGPSLIPGDAENSRLIKAISYQHEIKMPPAGKLKPEQIAALIEWVKMGAPDPREATPVAGEPEAKPAGYNTAEAAKTFWAFQPVRKPAAPKVRDKGWVQSPIDAFLLAKLAGKRPPNPLDRASLLRRVTFDLTGLPPTPAELEAFLNDTAPGAFERVVNRLLASPHYGERWARHWLDLMRYAETNGHEYDNDKHEPWRYRDYLIRAFNADLPYDQFIREHIAGDLLPNKRLREDGQAWESPLGTTAFWFNEVLNSATDSEKSRADDVDNQIDVITKAFQGLTVACARCHDHKFDPIPTADYYALAGVLHSTEIREAALDSPERTRKLAELSARIRQISKIAPVPVTKASYRDSDKVFESFAGSSFGKWTPQGPAFGSSPFGGSADSRSAGSGAFMGTLTSPKFRTGKERYLHVRIAGSATDTRYRERSPLRFTIVADGYKGQHIFPDGAATAQWKTLGLVFERERTCYFEIVDRSRSGWIAVDEIVFSDSPKPPEDPAAAEPIPVAPALPQLAALEREVPESEFAMVAEDLNPHNVRLHIRGSHKNLGEEIPRGFLRVVPGAKPAVAATASGRLELASAIASPSNPLTARVMVNRIWKHHFGQGIVRSTDNFGKMGEPPSDPALLDFLAASFVESGWSIKAMHRLMLLSSAYQSEMPVRRLEGEAIRDAVLSVAGTLNRDMYGPSVPPHISSYQDGRGKPPSGPLDGDGRRSIYIQVRRNFMTPLFVAFDYPPPISAMGNRTVSTVPSQALMMMNNEFVAQQAAKWAARIIGKLRAPEQRLEQMYTEAFARKPERAEVERILAFVESQGARSEAAVWADVAHVLLNSPEFIYVR